MKKLFFALFTLAVVAVGCEKDEIDALNASLIKVEQKSDAGDAQLANALESARAEVLAALAAAREFQAGVDAAQNAAFEAARLELLNLIASAKAEVIGLLDAAKEQILELIAMHVSDIEDDIANLIAAQGLVDAAQNEAAQAAVDSLTAGIADARRAAVLGDIRTASQAAAGLSALAGEVRDQASGIISNTLNIESLRAELEANDGDIAAIVTRLNSLENISASYDQDTDTLTVTIGSQIFRFTGLRGPAGAQGEDGEDGDDGQDGEDGEDGAQGPQGTSAPGARVYGDWSPAFAAQTANFTQSASYTVGGASGTATRTVTVSSQEIVQNNDEATLNSDVNSDGDLLDDVSRTNTVYTAVVSEGESISNQHTVNGTYAVSTDRSDAVDGFTFGDWTGTAPTATNVHGDWSAWSPATAASSVASITQTRSRSVESVVAAYDQTRTYTVDVNGIADSPAPVPAPSELTRTIAEVRTDLPNETETQVIANPSYVAPQVPNGADTWSYSEWSGNAPSATTVLGTPVVTVATAASTVEFVTETTTTPRESVVAAYNQTRTATLNVVDAVDVPAPAQESLTRTVPESRTDLSDIVTTRQIANPDYSAPVTPPTGITATINFQAVGTLASFHSGTVSLNGAAAQNLSSTAVTLTVVSGDVLSFTFGLNGGSTGSYTVTDADVTAGSLTIDINSNAATVSNSN